MSARTKESNRRTPPPFFDIGQERATWPEVIALRQTIATLAARLDREDGPRTNAVEQFDALIAAFGYYNKYPHYCDGRHVTGGAGPHRKPGEFADRFDCALGTLVFPYKVEPGRYEDGTPSGGALASYRCPTCGGEFTCSFGSGWRRVDL